MPDLSISDAGRLPAAGDVRSRLRAAANQFEGTFLRELLKPVSEGGLADDDDADSVFARSAAERQFAEMLNASLAERTAGSLGIAPVIERQLGRNLGPDHDKGMTR